MQFSIAANRPDDENPDVREEAREVAGDGWVNARNGRLGGGTPEQAIDAGEEELARDILRSIEHIGIS